MRRVESAAGDEGSGPRGGARHQIITERYPNKRNLTHVPGMGVLLGIGVLGTLGRALEAGHWGSAAGAASFLGLLLASPVVGALPATRRWRADS